MVLDPESMKKLQCMMASAFLCVCILIIFVVPPLFLDADKVTEVPLRENHGATKLADKITEVPLRENHGATKLAPGHSLMTMWGESVHSSNVWQEYPRPQMVRPSWYNLNGLWHYHVASKGVLTQPPEQWNGQILVPFSLESALSGVGRILDAHEELWYKRHVNLSPLTGMRYLLHFGAVDFECDAWMNGQIVGRHIGGNTPFTFDVTKAVTAATEVHTLVLRVRDETGNYQLRGKQVQQPGKIFYTRVSGIWQTVWLESVPDTYIQSLKIETAIDPPRIAVAAHSVGHESQRTKLRVTGVGLLGAEQVEADATCAGTCIVTLKNARLWSPIDPNLYTFRVELLNEDGEVLDSVQAYAGIREISKRRDANGHMRITLNGEFIFPFGPLDQGWWPDGLLTPPSDEAMLYDIKYIKDSGFNLIRKHVKVEPLRYYYHCDRLGMMLWQDQPSGTEYDVDNFHVPPWTQLHKNPRDANWPDWAHQRYMFELKEMIDALYNSPSITVWVPFNEAWGQHRTMEVGRWLQAYDKQRLSNVASGGNFWPIGDIADQHAYPDPKFPLDDPRFEGFIKVVGEFGGHGFTADPDHLWVTSKEGWGYTHKSDLALLWHAYQLSIKKLVGLAEAGVGAGIYTQTTDVETEHNGLLTYDRKVQKLKPSRLRKLHTKLMNAAAAAAGQKPTGVD